MRFFIINYTDEPELPALREVSREELALGYDSPWFAEWAERVGAVKGISTIVTEPEVLPIDPLKYRDIEILVGDQVKAAQAEPIVARKDDSAKLRHRLAPPYAQDAYVRVLMYGERKYGTDNWKYLADLQGRYLDAIERHISEIKKGNLIDHDTGEHHMAHVMCSAAFVVDDYERTRLTVGEKK